MTTNYTIGKNAQHRFWVGGNALAYSANGINWLTTTALTQINALEYNGTIFVSGTTNSLAYSEDGTTWFSAGNAVLTSTAAIHSAGYGPRGSTIFVAAGTQPSGNTLAYSYDGINWTGLGNSMFGGDSSGTAIEWNGQYWLAAAVDGSNNLARSIAGTSGWTGIDVSYNIHAIIWNGSQWLIGGNTSAGAGVIAFSTSDDATAWTTSASCPIDSRVTGLAYNGGRTVAVGNGATHTQWHIVTIMEQHGPDSASHFSPILPQQRITECIGQWASSLLRELPAAVVKSCIVMMVSIGRPVPSPRSRHVQQSYQHRNNHTISDSHKTCLLQVAMYHLMAE